jgi:hypothetical protein
MLMVIGTTIGALKFPASSNQNQHYIQFYITMIVFTLKLLFIIISYMYTLLSKQGRRDDPNLTVVYM